MAQDVTFNITFIDKFGNVGRKLKSSIDKTTKSMKKFEGASAKMARGLKKVGKAAVNASGSMKKFGRQMTLAVTAPLAGLGILAIKAAADAEEMESKLGTVFGNSSDDIRSWADTVAKQMNRGSNLIRTQTANIGDFLKGLGFAGGEMEGLAKKLVVLTQDIGSFKNAKPEQVFLALQGAMVGNNESLKTLGISLLQNEVIAKAQQQTGRLTAKTFTTQEKAAASFALIVQKTKDAQGDAAKTSQSFTNQMLGLTGAMTDAKIVIGNELIPIVLPLVVGFANMVKNLAAANPKFLKMGIVVAALVAVIGPLLIFVGFAITAIAAISAPILIAVAAFAAFVAAVTAAVIWSEEIWNWIKKVADVASRLTPLGIMFGLIGDGILAVMDAFALFSFDSLTTQITDFLSGAGGKVLAFFGLSTDTTSTNETNVNIRVEGEVKGANTNIKATRSDRRTLQSGRNLVGEAA